MLRLRNDVVVAGLPAEADEAVAANKYPYNLNLAYVIGSSIVMADDISLGPHVACGLSGASIQKICE
jgi:hypothetical protein